MLKYHICFLSVSTYYCSGIDTCITLTTQPRYSRNRKPWHAKEGGKYLASLMSCHPLSLWICCASVIWCRGGWGAKIRFLYTKNLGHKHHRVRGRLGHDSSFDKTLSGRFTTEWIHKGQRQITLGSPRSIGLFLGFTNALRSAKSLYLGICHVKSMAEVAFLQCVRGCSCGAKTFAGGRAPCMPWFVQFMGFFQFSLCIDKTISWEWCVSSMKSLVWYLDFNDK